MSLIITFDKSETEGPTGQLVNVNFYFDGEHETCSLPLDYWSLSDYISQWVSAISRIIDYRQPAMLVTSIHDPEIFTNLVAWVLYPVSDGSVKIQQHLLIHSTFIVDHVFIRYESLLDREIISIDGDAISEWTITLSDLPTARQSLVDIKNLDML